MFCSIVMCLQPTIFCKGLVTFWTGQWLFSSMSPILVFQSNTLYKMAKMFEQTNGFSPVWVILCIFKWLPLINGTYSISLIKHVLLHNGEKHYACSWCDKILKHRYDLKNISWNVIWCFRAHLFRQVSHFEFVSFLRKGSWQ